MSGIVDMERFGTRYVCAEGNVFARVTDTVTFEIPFSDVQKNYGEEEARAVSISFFGKSINIFKKTSLYTENYDTISREESLPFLWFDTLPLSVFVESAIPYTEEMVTRTEDEARKLADEALERFFADNTTYTELLSADSSYTVTDNALIMQCSIEAIENIAAVSEFTVR